MAVKAGFGDLLEPGFRKIFFDKYSEIPEVFPSIFQVDAAEPSDSEKDSSVTGFGLPTLTAEGGAVDFEDPAQGYDSTYRHQKYTKGFKITEELYEDDRYRIMNKAPGALARSMRRGAENVAAGVFINGFTSTYPDGFSGVDSLPLFSTKHTREDGGATQSNASSTGITLTETNLETGLLALRAQLDGQGMKIAMKADTLIVPPALEKEAKVLIGSNLKPGVTTYAANDVNVYKGTLGIIPWDYLTSTTAWFLIDADQDELHWFWRIKAEFKQDELMETGVARYMSRMRASCGWSDWRGTWGSKGDGAGYSG